VNRGEAAHIRGPLFGSLLAKQWTADKVYAAGLGVATLALACTLVYIQFHVKSLVPPGAFPWAGLVVLSGVALFAERYSIRAPSGLEVSATFLAFLLSAATIGPLGGFITGTVSSLVLIKRDAVFRSVWYTIAAAFVSGVTGLCYWLLMLMVDTSHDSALMVAGVGLTTGVLFQMVNVLVVSPMMRLRRGVSAATVWREAFQPFLPFHFFFLAISLGLIYIYRLYALKPGGVSQIYSTLLILICLLPVLGLIYAFRAYAHQRELAQRNAALAARNEKLFLQAVKSQVTALDVKDNYTARHSAAVARWATDIAEALELPKREQNVTHLASLVHDVGKIGVPDEVLNHPGKLAEVILHHHEKYFLSELPPV
jgi:hypothetical protein